MRNPTPSRASREDRLLPVGESQKRRRWWHSVMFSMQSIYHSEIMLISPSGKADVSLLASSHTSACMPAVVVDLMITLNLPT